jgi:hypothetical protein
MTYYYSYYGHSNDSYFGDSFQVFHFQDFLEIERLENIYRNENRYWELELDSLFESNDDSYFITFEEEFQPNEDSEDLEPRKLTLEETFLLYSQGLESLDSAGARLGSLCDEMNSFVLNNEEVETCVSPKFFEEFLIECASFSPEIQSPSDDESIEIEFASSPYSFSVIEPLELPVDSCESVETFKTSTLFADEDFLPNLFSMDVIPACAPPPIPIENFWGDEFNFLGPLVYLSPLLSKSPIVRPKFQIGDGSLFPPPTCLPFFKRNYYFPGGMFTLEGPPLIFQSQIPFWVDPQLFRLLVYS